MKTANAALVIAAGIILLWVVTSGRTKNLSAAWAALFGSSPTGASVGSSVGAAVGNLGVTYPASLPQLSGGPTPGLDSNIPSLAALEGFA